jgi:hypothetical protein
MAASPTTGRKAADQFDPAANRLTRESIPSWLRYAALLTIGATAAVIGAIVHRRLGQGVAIRTWQASQYWVDYSDGFVRRGLPGQVLADVAGGPPSSALVTCAAVTLTTVAACAFVALAMTIYRTAESRSAAVAGAAVIAVSPFTFPLLAQDAGRYDTVVFAAAAIIALAGMRLRNGPAVAITVSTAVLVAVATEEISVLFVVPLALACLRRVRSRPTTIAVAVLPGLVAAGASLLIRPRETGLTRAIQQAHSARPDIPLDGQMTAIVALRQTPTSVIDQMRALSPMAPVLLTAVFVAFFLGTVYLTWACLGKPRPLMFRYFLGAYAAGALALSIVGIDYRRWWAMAFAAAAWTVVVLRDTEGITGRTAHRPPALFVVTMLVLSVLLQASPVAGLL